MRTLRILACAATGFACAAALPAPALATPASIAVDDTAPALKQQDDDSWQGTLAITNLTGDGLQLSVAPGTGAPDGCKPTLSKKAIGAAQAAQPKLTVPDECKADDEASVVLTASGATTQAVPLTPSLKPGQGEPNWHELRVFVIALLVAIAGLFLLFTQLRPYKPNQKLEHLDTAYDFKESWVSNVTVVAGLLTAVFGSADVVKAFLGEDADRSIALATVGAAVAVGLIGAGPIILTAAKTQLDTAKPGSPQVFTVTGLVLATAVTFAGAFGQLWVGWKSGEALDLGGAEDHIWIAFGAAALLLLWYTLANLGATLRTGANAPPPAEPTELGKLLKLLEGILKANAEVPDTAVPLIVSRVGELVPDGVTSPGDEPYRPQRRRSAMP